MKSVLIKNGTISTASDTFKGDLLIRGEKIDRIGIGLDEPHAKIIDASGTYVLPGGVDVHTHFALSVGEAKVGDGFYIGTASAAFGGTTCVVEHPGFGPQGCGLKTQIDRYLEIADGQAVVDYGIHGVFQHMNDKILEEMAELPGMGVSSAKIYLTYDGALRDYDILRIMERAKELGILLAFHAENDAITRFMRERFIAEGRTEAICHALSRPDWCEAEAITRILALARTVDVPVYIVHLSTALGLDAIRRARMEGQTTYAEVCPQHLLLDESCYLEKDGKGLKCVMAPPARRQKDREALWRGLADGSVDVVATDHCSFQLADKLRLGSDDFGKCPGGIPGVETRLPLLFSEGVRKGRISLNRFVELTATAPAKLMGLYPKKGGLFPGADADVVVFDPELEKTVTPDNLYHNADYSPYEGMHITGWPVLTMVRGQVVMANNTLTAEKGWGRHIDRQTS